MATKTTTTHKPSNKRPPAASALRVALYAGSFDPPTLGHLDIIERAAGLCDRLIVGIGTAATKTPLLSIEERVALVADLCRVYPKVSVHAFTGLAVNFARQQGVSILVRGVRSLVDFTYETQMAQMNRAMDSELDTIFLATKPALSHISSSLAREIARHGGDTSLLVPKAVIKILGHKFK